MSWGRPGQPYQDAKTAEEGAPKPLLRHEAFLETFLPNSLVSCWPHWLVPAPEPVTGGGIRPLLGN